MASKSLLDRLTGCTETTTGKDFTAEAKVIEACGFVVIPAFITPGELENLKQESILLVELAHEQVADEDASEWECTTRGCIFQAIPPISDTNHQHMFQGNTNVSQRFDLKEERKLQESIDLPSAQDFQKLRTTWPCHQDSCEILLGRKMASLVYAILGCKGYLYNEQFIVKPPRSNRSEFRWHRDSDSCSGDNICYQPYISMRRARPSKVESSENAKLQHA
eukprot:scaffold92686_cov32-Prasinocladus_malaysianus.AAC.1